MSSNLLDLKEPEQIDWDNYNPGSKYMPPPPALGVDGKALVYFGTLPKITDQNFEATDEGFLQVVADPITIVKSGSADGYQIRFSRFNVKKFQKNGKTIEASSLGNLLRGAGVVAKPQKNEEYKAATKSVGGKVISFTLDWYAKNKETGEEVRGFAAFPDDPERPGLKKSILKAGDLINVLDDKGQPTGEKKPVQSEVLFANARFRYVVDPNRK